ncbi:hypothetical protein ES703_53129 [subsurface metagenome]
MNFDDFDKEKERLISMVRAKIKELKVILEKTEAAFPTLKGTPIWTDELTEDEKRDYFEDYEEFIKENPNIKMITGGDYFLAKKKATKKELEHVKKMLKDFELAETADELILMFLRINIHIIGHSYEESDKMIKEDFKKNYIECPFCKKRTYLPKLLGECLYCGTKFEEK